MSNSNAHCCDNSQVRSTIYGLLVHRLHWLILGSPLFEPLWLWVAASEPHYRILIDRNQPVSMLRKGRDFRACGCSVCFTWYRRHLRAITGSVKCELTKKLKKSLLLVLLQLQDWSSPYSEFLFHEGLTKVLPAVSSFSVIGTRFKEPNFKQILYDCQLNTMPSPSFLD